MADWFAHQRLHSAMYLHYVDVCHEVERWIILGGKVNIQNLLSALSATVVNHCERGQKDRTEVVPQSSTENISPKYYYVIWQHSGHSGEKDRVHVLSVWGSVASSHPLKMQSSVSWRSARRCECDRPLTLWQLGQAPAPCALWGQLAQIVNGWMTVVTNITDEPQQVAKAENKRQKVDMYSHIKS